MAIKFVSIKCPECGAPLDIEEGRKQIFCSYCGTKVMIQNDNEYIYRNIDEAGIEQAETERIIRLRELELREAREKRTGRLHGVLITIWLVISVILIGIAIGIMFSSVDGPMYGFCFLFYVCAPIVGGGAYLVFKVIPDKGNKKN